MKVILAWLNHMTQPSQSGLELSVLSEYLCSFTTLNPKPSKARVPPLQNPYINILTAIYNLRAATLNHLAECHRPKQKPSVCFRSEDE